MYYSATELDNTGVVLLVQVKKCMVSVTTGYRTTDKADINKIPSWFEILQKV